MTGRPRCTIGLHRRKRDAEDTRQFGARSRLWPAWLALSV